MIRLIACLVAISLLGCTGAGGRIPGPPDGGVAVTPEVALSFHERALGFYRRLVQRRFNTLETFNDRRLRQHFRTLDGFYDYYADVADRLHDAHFEKSRPVQVAIEEFVFDEPGAVRVQVRFVGNDDRPLRPTRTTLIRLDLWEFSDGNWWVAPGKL